MRHPTASGKKVYFDPGTKTWILKWWDTKRREYTIAHFQSEAIARANFKQLYTVEDEKAKLEGR